jgi:hypothetical protein
MEDSVRHWAMIKSKLKEAQQKVLDGEGMTWKSLDELKDNALIQMDGQAFVDTEYGRVQIVSRPVWEQKSPKVIATNRSLKLTEGPNG